MFPLVRDPVPQCFLFFLVAHFRAIPFSRPSWAGTSSDPTSIHTGAYTSPARAPRLLADTHTRVRPTFPLIACPHGQPSFFFLSFPLFSNVRHALLLANVVADSRYMLFTEFAGENGRRLREYLAAVRTAVLAGLEHGGSDPFRAVH
jgi:hypothetical protein